ncbi:MAG: hypothetical protein PHR35_04175 [Kiritimatiellae bacterium]|nr:hypothetical protein [Kiritimatiellia bacterium]
MADRLNTLRMARAQTWADFAESLGISRKYLFLLRNGTRNIGPRLERQIRQLERDAQEQDGNNEGGGGGLLRERSAVYDTSDAARLLISLAAENATMKNRLDALERELKRMQGDGHEDKVEGSERISADGRGGAGGDGADDRRTG